MVVDTAVGRLVAGSRITDFVAADPTIAEATLAPPIVIVGGWRTGTTFLFRLLASDPRLRAPLPAELSAPWRFAQIDADRRDELLDRAAGAHDLLHLLNPMMATVHASGPRLAEECVLAMGTDMRNWGFTSTVRLDTYAAWLANQSLAGSYQRYRLALQLLSARDSRRLVLKAPAHTAELDHVAATFPGAVIVHLHRDIVETIASGASLFGVFRSTYSDAVDPIELGRFQTEQTERWFRRAAAFRSTPAAATVVNVDLGYRRLVDEPATALRSIYEAAELPPPSDVTSFVEAYRHAHPRDEHGRHRYDPSDFGLDPDELRSRFAFLADTDLG